MLSKYHPLINAKMDSILESAMFKGSGLHYRCLIFADEFNVNEDAGPFQFRWIAELVKLRQH